MRAALLAALIATGPAACSREALPATRPDNDGSVAADLLGASCTDVAGAIADWLATHETCATDADCDLLCAPCTPGEAHCCTYRAHAAGAYFDSLAESYFDRRCYGMYCQACPVCFDGDEPRAGCPGVTPTCSAGRCIPTRR